MNRIIRTIGLLTVGLALTATSASAQNYGHYGYGHGQHRHPHFDQGRYYGGHSHQNHYNDGYHASDYLTYPVRPPSYVHSAPAYDEPMYFDAPEGGYDGTYSRYCPQAEYGHGDQYAPLQSQGQLREYAYGQSQGLNDPSHDGHDHSGHDHAGHDHSNHGDVYASPTQPQDRSYVPAPSLELNPRVQPSLGRKFESNSGTRQTAPDSQPSERQRNEAPVQMEGLPPQI